jgi:hypothetical protein
VRGGLSEKMRRDVCVRWSSPETGETVARRSNLPRGNGLWCSEWPRGVGRRRGEPVSALEWGEAVGRGQNSNGRRGVRWPLKRQAASGSTRGDWKNWGPG